MAEIRLPQYGMGMTDGTIIAWHKAEGDRVAKGELLCDIEAAKTTVEMESPQSGVLRRIIVKADENIPVNTVIAEIDEDRPAPPEIRPTPSEVRPIDIAGAAPAVPAHHTASPARSESREPDVQAEPGARRAARELGVDLSLVLGTGPDGRILMKDVQAFASKPAVVAPPPATDSSTASEAPTSATASVIEEPAYTESTHTMTRRTIARRLTESKQQVPHFYVKASCAVDALGALRKDINEGGAVPVSMNDLIVRAVALALKEVPDINVSWSEKALLHHANVDVAVAVATPRGLVTPIVRKAQRKSVGEIAAELKDLVGRAREGKLKPEEYQGGSVSVSNLGMLGVEEFSAIINTPQSAIFAVGASEPRAVVRDGQLDIATMMTVTVSVDHRAIDGAVAAKGLAAFKRLIEAPARLLD